MKWWDENITMECRRCNNLLWFSTLKKEEVLYKKKKKTRLTLSVDPAVKVNSAPRRRLNEDLSSENFQIAKSRVVCPEPAPS